MKCYHCRSTLVSGKTWSCRRCDYHLVCCSHRNKSTSVMLSLYEIINAYWPMLRFFC